MENPISNFIEAVSRARARIRVITWGRYWRIQLDKLEEAVAHLSVPVPRHEVH